MSRSKRLSDMDEVELKDLFRRLSRQIEDALPDEPGAARGKPLFCLLVFDGAGLAQYASNAERRSMIMALEEFLANLKSRTDVPRS